MYLAAVIDWYIEKTGSATCMEAEAEHPQCNKNALKYGDYTEGASGEKRKIFLVELVRFYPA